MMDKDAFKIDCDAANSTDTSYVSSTENTVSFDPLPNFTINNMVVDFFEFQTNVCDAEIQTAKLMNSYNGIRASLASTFALIVIIFAGGWSDKKKLRKPLMIFAIFGEILGTLVSLLSAIFFEEIPLMYSRILDLVLPSMFGGTGLMMIGCFAYLTSVTTEENRISRFGTFTNCITLVGAIGQFNSGKLLTLFGFVSTYVISIVIYILAILLIVFYLKEANEQDEPAQPDTDKAGLENPAFENIEIQDGKSTNNKVVTSQPLSIPEPDDLSLSQKVKTFLIEFFDPTLVKDLVQTLISNHKNYGRTILYLCLVNVFMISCATGDVEHINSWGRNKLHWGNDDYGHYLAFATLMAFFGTVIMTNVMTKLFNISDGMIGIVGSVGSIISKIFILSAKTAAIFWIGIGFDLFVTCKGLSIRSMLSKAFDESNLVKVFSLLSLADTLVGFVASHLYAFVFNESVDTDASKVFYLSLAFLVPSLVIYIITHIIFEYKRKKPEESDGAETAPDVMTTKI